MRRRHSFGYTAIEIVTVLLALGGLFLLTYPWLQYFVDRAYAYEARLQISKIHQAAEQYLSKHEQLPSSVHAMAEQGYLDLPSEVSNRWQFRFVKEDGLAVKIQGRSTEVMSKGADKIVELDLHTGQFRGYGSSIAYKSGVP